jgi:hypothetical protein
MYLLTKLMQKWGGSASCQAVGTEKGQLQKKSTYFLQNILQTYAKRGLLQHVKTLGTIWIILESAPIIFSQLTMLGALFLT